jgi:cytoskeletal protein RodZ
MPKFNEKGIAFTILLIAFLAIALLIAIGFLIQVNFFSNPKPKDAPQSQPQEVPATSSATTSCDQGCQDLIDGKLAKLKQELEAEIKQSKSTTTTPGVSSQTTSTPSESYIYFGVNGSTQSTGWSDLPGSDVKFNSTNYPGAKSFYFQASLQSDAPDRTTYARIYDLTHSTGVSGSDISFTGLTATFVQSSALNLSNGDLQLRVQIHGVINNATIYNPRIKIVY